MLCKPAYTMDCSGIGSTSWQIDRWGHGAGGSYSYTHFMVGYLFEFELVNRYKQRVPLLLLIVFSFTPLSAEGVQLLCLIDKGLDACRYLQTYGEWDRAAWLAKVAPPVLEPVS